MDTLRSTPTLPPALWQAAIPRFPASFAIRQHPAPQSWPVEPLTCSLHLAADYSSSCQGHLGSCMLKMAECRPAWIPE